MFSDIFHVDKQYGIMDLVMFMSFRQTISPAKVSDCVKMGHLAAIIKRKKVRSEDPPPTGLG